MVRVQALAAKLIAETSATGIAMNFNAAYSTRMRSYRNPEADCRHMFSKRRCSGIG
jgi:hypothetical protein